MPYALLLLTASQADAPENGDRIIEQLDFHTGSLNGNVLDTIEVVVERYIGHTELDGWEAIWAESTLKARIAKACAAMDEGNPRGQFTYGESHTDENMHTLTVWIGPAE